MADQFDDLIANIKALVVEITDPPYVQVDDHEPLKVYGIQAAVLMDTGDQGQFETGTRQESHTPRIRTYIPLGNQAGWADEQLRKLWSRQVEKFTAHVTLDDPVSGGTTVCTRMRYETFYLVVAGVKCRCMDTFLLDVQMIIPTTYA